MSKRFKVRKVRYSDHERWVGLPHYMLKAPSWKALSPNAKALLIEVWARFNGINNGSISYSVREAEEIGMNRDTASKAFRELVDRGFLAVARNSAFSVKTKSAREWRVTALPTSDGAKPTNDFMRPAAVDQKFRTRSVQPDTQSALADRGAVCATNGKPMVSPDGLSAPDSVPSQSVQPDTSNYHGDSLQNGHGVGVVGVIGKGKPPRRQVGTNPPVPPSPKRARGMTGAAVHPRAGRTPRTSSSSPSVAS